MKMEDVVKKSVELHGVNLFTHKEAVFEFMFQSVQHSGRMLPFDTDFVAVNCGIYIFLKIRRMTIFPVEVINLKVFFCRPI
jgi:hypothetical protein